MNTQKAKRVLRSIQKIPHKRFVLHGSLVRSNTLLPNRPNLEIFTNKRKARGIREKAVYGTLISVVAVIYATLPNNTQWKYVKKEKYFHILHREEYLTPSSGYIHVCRRTSFDYGVGILASKQAVRVVRTIRVSSDVLEYLWRKRDVRFFNRP